MNFYIHIPFCQSKKCGYCDFYSETNTQFLDQYLQSLKQEIEERLIFKSEAETIFLGGGTPSLLTATQIESLLDKLSSKTTITKKTEISMETNPQNLSKSYLRDLKKIGINRLSIGIQTFNQALAKKIGRARILEQKELLNSIHCALNIFDNCSIDLMFGLPGQSITEINKELNLIPKELQHLSYYCLTPETNTPLFSSLEASIPTSDLSAEMQNIIIEFLQTKGWVRYEISNFAIKGYECKHNQDCWSQKDYLGFGAGAVSTYKNKRYEGSLLKDYLKGIYQKNIYALSNKDIYNEFLMLKLRTTKGFAMQEFQIKFGKEKLTSFLKQIQPFHQFFVVTVDNCALTQKGLSLFDSLLVELFI